MRNDGPAIRQANMPSDKFLGFGYPGPAQLLSSFNCYTLFILPVPLYNIILSLQLSC